MNKFKLQITHPTKSDILNFGPAFNKTFLEEVFQLQQLIEQLGQNQSGKGLQNICFAPMATDAQILSTSQCVVQSLFGYFGNKMDNFHSNRTDDGYTINYLNTLDKCLRYYI